MFNKSATDPTPPNTQAPSAAASISPPVTAAPSISPATTPSTPTMTSSDSPMTIQPAQATTSTTQTDPPQHSSHKLLFIISAIALIIGLVVVGYLWMSKPAPAPSKSTPTPAAVKTTATPEPSMEPTPDTSTEGAEPVACPLDAKICADGSSVGRTGPNCEFAACPGEEDTTLQDATPAGTTDINTDTSIEQ